MIIRIRISGAIVAAATLAGTTACTSPNQATPTAAASPTTVSMAATASAQPPAETLTPLIAQALPDAQGKTFTSAIVDFPPGARALPHRHGDAFVYAYVLEGAVRSQLNDMPVKTYRQGENWVEQPGDHHVRTENTSQTEPARLLVVFVANTGAGLKVDDPHS